ncbi:hypothetical protein BGZ83_002072 [Gryganskiella cystojenkinii]|nr:hypothetical protein BGZ83_002072 [Gryganskiella cystojenkinii]
MTATTSRQRDPPVQTSSWLSSPNGPVRQRVDFASLPGYVSRNHSTIPSNRQSKSAFQQQSQNHHHHHSRRTTHASPDYGSQEGGRKSDFHSEHNDEEPDNDDDSLPDLDDLFDENPSPSRESSAPPVRKPNTPGLKRHQHPIPSPTRVRKAPYSGNRYPERNAAASKYGQSEDFQQPQHQIRSQQQAEEPWLSSDPLDFDFGTDSRASSQPLAADESIVHARSGVSDTSHALNDTFDQLNEILRDDTSNTDNDGIEDNHDATVSSPNSTPELAIVLEMNQEDELEGEKDNHPDFQKTEDDTNGENTGESVYNVEVDEAITTAGPSEGAAVARDGSEEEGRGEGEIESTSSVRLQAVEELEGTGTVTLPFEEDTSNIHSPRQSGSVPAAAYDIPASTNEFKARLEDMRSRYQVQFQASMDAVQSLDELEVIIRTDIEARKSFLEQRGTSIQGQVRDLRTEASQLQSKSPIALKRPDQIF